MVVIVGGGEEGGRLGILPRFKIKAVGGKSQGEILRDSFGP